MNILDKSISREKLTEAFGRQSSISKVDKYKWAKENLSFGTYMEIPKRQLNIDGRYQRGTSLIKVREMARNFDAILFGTLIVAKRPDGSYWVMEGGHRASCAMLRDDINNVPCIVHNIEDVSEEARKFYGLNNYKSSMSAVQKYTAMLVAGDSDAKVAKNIVEENGYKVKQTISSSWHFAAIGTLMAYIKVNPHIARKSFEICATIARGDVIDQFLLGGMCTLLGRFRDDTLFIDKNLPEKLEAIGIQAVKSRMRDESYDAGKGGHTVAAKGILRAYNDRRSSNRKRW